jgi:hypothetical protein
MDLTSPQDLIPPPRPLKHDEWPPNYSQVFAYRDQELRAMEADPSLIDAAKAFYKTHPVEFICHWCSTYDPRLAFANQMPTRLPFILFERQAEMVNFLMACLEEEQPGLIDKARDTGATWVACAFSVWLWLFRDGASIGFGSRKEALVDRIGDLDAIFPKIRQMISEMPSFFWPPGFSFEKHSAFMRLINPANESTITGEGGDNIGRGGRKLIYFVDEAAHLEHAEMVAAALGDNTRVQIDISTSNGVGTVYDRKKEAGVEWTPNSKIARGTTRIFTLNWYDHPAKTQEWYTTREKAARDTGLLHIFRQEVDRDPTASLQGIIIRPEWVKAAIDAHIDLKFDMAGGYMAAFDPYDEGGDSHALALRKGSVLLKADDWNEGDTGEATRFVIGQLASFTPVIVNYDCCGIGAGVKSEANRLSRDRKPDGSFLMPQGITFQPWDAGLAPLNPKLRVVPNDANSPRNEDFYANLKAQGWWSLARRFENTYRARNEGIEFPASEMISISSDIVKLRQLMRELSQPVIKKSGDLRILVDKKPEGAKSPNLADAIMMCYFPLKMPMVFSADILQRAANEVRR